MATTARDCEAELVTDPIRDASPAAGLAGVASTAHQPPTAHLERAAPVSSSPTTSSTPAVSMPASTSSPATASPCTECSGPPHPPPRLRLPDRQPVQKGPFGRRARRAGARIDRSGIRTRRHQNVADPALDRRLETPRLARRWSKAIWRRASAMMSACPCDRAPRPPHGDVDSDEQRAARAVRRRGSARQARRGVARRHRRGGRTRQRQGRRRGGRRHRRHAGVRPRPRGRPRAADHQAHRQGLAQEQAAVHHPGRARAQRVRARAGRDRADDRRHLPVLRGRGEDPPPPRPSRRRRRTRPAGEPRSARSRRSRPSPGRSAPTSSSPARSS